MNYAEINTGNCYTLILCCKLFRILFVSAKKYDVKDLILACSRYLTTCLTASNALCLLSQARFFDEPFLMKRCLQVIDANTDEALKSPGNVILCINMNTLTYYKKTANSSF